MLGVRLSIGRLLRSTHRVAVWPGLSVVRAYCWGVLSMSDECKTAVRSAMYGGAG